MKVDIKKLKSGLEKLTGRDFIDAAREEQTAPTVEGLDTGLMLRLAAKALDTPAQKLLELPVRDFMRLTRWLGEFFGDISAEETSDSSTDA